MYPTDLLLLLPGEVEQDVSTRVPSYVPSVVAQPLTPGVKPGPLAKGADEHRDEVLLREFSPSRNCLAL